MRSDHVLLDLTLTKAASLAHSANDFWSTTANDNYYQVEELVSDLLNYASHGKLRFGCKNRPLENESFTMGIGDSKEFAVLSWITEQTPESCNNGALGK